MPTTLYDEDGQTIENALTAEEAKELQQKIEALEASSNKTEEYKTKAEELEKTLQEKEEALSNLSSKEFSFRQFEKKTKAEKEEILKKASEKERAFIEEISSIKDELNDYKVANIRSYEADVLEALAGQDEDLKEKLKETAKEFVGDAKTKEDIYTRYKRAYTVLKEAPAPINPINQFVPTQTSQHPSGSSKRQKYTDTAEGKANMKKWFNIDLDKKEK